jgi:hypothetical protein
MARSSQMKIRCEKDFFALKRKIQNGRLHRLKIGSGRKNKKAPSGLGLFGLFFCFFRWNDRGFFRRFFLFLSFYCGF